MATLRWMNAPQQAAATLPAERRRFFAASLVLAGAAWFGALAPAQAALVVAPISLTLNLAAGDLGVVRGDITNTTNFDLRSGDFFGSFSGFASDTLIIDQLLGLTDVGIDDRAITRNLDLFSVQLGAGAQAGQSYQFEFFFIDINNNQSSTSIFTVNVQGAQAVPEPGAVSLVGAGLFWLAMSGRRRQPQPTREN